MDKLLIDCCRTGSGETASFFNPKLVPTIPMVVRPADQQPENFSRRIWGKVTEALRVKDMDKATDGKTAIEEEQRRLRSEREKNKVAWIPKHFQSASSSPKVVHWVLREDDEAAAKEGQSSGAREEDEKEKEPAES